MESSSSGNEGPRAAADARQELAFVDDLTGLSNRRRLHRLFEGGTEALMGDRSAFALAVIDVDLFKQVNDTFGHLTGDAVLIECALLLRSLARERDHLIRYGGDEFVLVMPDTDRDEAAELGERIRTAVARKRFFAGDHNRFLTVPVSVSVGIASAPSDGTGLTELMDRADRALYASKRAGRDRVTAASEVAAGAAAPEAELPAHPDLVGRRSFLELFAGCWRDVQAGASRGIVLQGASGVGKTRLLEEAVALAAGAGLATTSLLPDEDLHEQPFATLAALARQLEDEQHDRLERSQDGPPPTREAWIRHLAPYLDARPRVVAIDDGDAMDEASATVLRELAGGDTPLGLIVATSHVGAEKKDPAAVGTVRRLQVPPLDPGEVADLLQALLGSYLSFPGFPELIAKVSGGNPLFVQEILRGCLADGRILRKRRGWLVQAMTEADL
ncbi:MAG: diguanylate cyclase, partial [Thermoanaerobaculia bacterium]|nr:diguanylate cyclase [Thermoanaerobaculia bacterium]